LLSIAALGVACIDLSAPKGPASISAVQLPAGFVVRGDVMRDSTGAAAMPIVKQFDAAGHPFGGGAAQFFVTDSAPVAHFDATSGALVGDKLGIVHFIGQVGSLQTPSVTVPVTVAPTTMVVGTGAVDTNKVPITDDTTFASTIPVIVRGIGDTTVQGVLVHYTFTRTLASNDATNPAVFLVAQNHKQASVDTTDSGGLASKLKIAVRPRLLSDVAVATGQKVDSVIIQASASYKGTPLTGSPLTFVFHIVGSLTP
jgi:hypothetical protein